MAEAFACILKLQKSIRNTEKIPEMLKKQASKQVNSSPSSTPHRIMLTLRLRCEFPALVRLRKQFLGFEWVMKIVSHLTSDDSIPAADLKTVEKIGK